jgi:hypothetical protein
MPWLTEDRKKNGKKWAIRIVCGLMVLVLAFFIFIGIQDLLTKQTQPPSFWMGLTWWAAITLIAFVIANAAFFLTRKYGKTLHLDAALLFSTFWAVAAGTVIILTIFYAFPNSAIQQAHAFLSIAGGCVVGWALGMYISPQDSSERSQFAKIGAAVAGLASGYTIKSVQTWIGQQQNQHYQVYCVLAGICALLTTATIYNIRAYGLNALTISFDHGDASDATKVLAKLTDTVYFRAAVIGPDDTSVRWSVMPSTPGGGAIGVITVDGKFTTDQVNFPNGGTCKVMAQSSANPKLIDLVEVTTKA